LKEADMGILDYIRPVPTIKVGRVRALLKEKSLEELNLVDVRQLKEYEREHIPGAALVPLGELPGRLDEFDSAKPTIAYCAIGGRSRAAASIFLRAGFNEVYSMKGGIRAWKGPAAEGSPETGMAYFSEATSAEEIIALAWSLEEGMRRFYGAIEESVEEREVRVLYGELKEAEVAHQAALLDLFGTVTDKRPETGEDFFRRVLPEDEVGEVVEGGLRLSEAIAWARRKPVAEVLQFAITLEAQLYDLYWRFKGRLQEEKAKDTVRRIAEEEKKHLERLTRLLESRL
jgi:rhodanese-related sulfurtransferase/rubrerythrin